MAAPVSKFEQWRGFAVHLLTASGAFWAFLSIIAAADHRWVAMFGWLGLAQRELDTTRVLGVALLIGGVVLIRR